MLEKSAIDFSQYGVEAGHLLNGESDVTYEEMEFVMNLNPSTQMLSINLKQEITSSKHKNKNRSLFYPMISVPIFCREICLQVT